MQSLKKISFVGHASVVSRIVSRPKLVASLSLFSALTLPFYGYAQTVEGSYAPWQPLAEMETPTAPVYPAHQGTTSATFHGEQGNFTQGYQPLPTALSAALPASYTAPVWVPPRNPTVYLKQLANAENWPETLHYTAYLLQQNPQDTEALFYRAVAIAQQGEVSQALALLDAIQNGSRDYVNAAERYKQLLLKYAQKPFIGHAKPLKVAVLLPLSGPQKAIGETLLNTLQLAAFQEFPTVSLYPYDTQDSAEMALEQAQKALATGVDAVIGPLFSAQAEAIKPLARRQNTPFLVLSSDRHVAGRNLHVFNYRPDAQTKLVTQHALQQGAKTFAALVPATPYGYDVLEVFQKTVEEGGGTVANIAFFNTEKADISEALNQLFEKKEAGEEVFSPYDGLFLPTDAAHLPLVISQMALFDVDRMTNMLTLGTAAWTDANMRGGMAYMRDGRFALPPKNPDFIGNYKAEYGAVPPQMAQVAYDALMVLSQAQNRAGGLSANLLSPTGFMTTSGAVRMMDDGLPERDYPIWQITQRKFVHVKPLDKTVSPPLPRPLHPTEKQGWNWFNFGNTPSGREAFPETETYAPQQPKQRPPQPWEKREEVQPVPQPRPEKSLFERFIPW